MGATTEWRGGFPGPESAVKQAGCGFRLQGLGVGVSGSGFRNSPKQAVEPPVSPGQ